MHIKLNRYFIFFALFFASSIVVAQTKKISTVALNGWANNSVNTVIFRKNALTTYGKIQYTAYYDSDEYVVLAKRNIHSDKWIVQRSNFKGDATDAHKSISIVADGSGVVHLAWGQHNNRLNYAKTNGKGSLVLGAKLTMLGESENKVSYPEFYKMANGDLLFFYRDGGSGNGNLMINRYNVSKQNWIRVQNNLIDGEGKRNAYWQATIDRTGTIHVSWVWRESPDVSSNHDLCYAKSIDGGQTWMKSNNEKYQLPINAGNAEYALIIPQKSELINQTSMFADHKGNVFIASYWRDRSSAVPQYHLVYRNDGKWNTENLNFRKTSFSLSGGGTKKIPISRPQIVAWPKGNKLSAAIIFRDEERGNKVSIAYSRNLNIRNWKIDDFTAPVGDWEPAYDAELWKDKGILSLFIQEVKQIDGEGNAQSAPTAVKVLDWKPE